MFLFIAVIKVFVRDLHKFYAVTVASVSSLLEKNSGEDLEHV